MEEKLDGYYRAANRKAFIINHILSQIPGGLRAWNKDNNSSYLLDKEEAYQRIGQKLRDIRKVRLTSTARNVPPPRQATKERKAALALRTQQQVKETENREEETKKRKDEEEKAPPAKKPKLARKPALPLSSATRTTPPRRQSAVTRQTTVPRQSPSRDITPNVVKDELIATLRSEIVRLRELLKNQDLELQALRMLKGNPLAPKDASS